MSESAGQEGEMDVQTGEIERHTPKNPIATQNRGGRRGVLTPSQKRELMRELAIRTKTHVELGEQFGMSRTGIGNFAKRHEFEIDEMRNDLENQFAGLWIAKKENRLADYQEDLDALRGTKTEYHHEWIKAKAQIRRNVAEELGQLPPRQAVTIVPVQHIIVGVDMDNDL